MAKKNKIKLPKKIAGHKISKGARRNLTWLIRMLERPEAKALIASGAGMVFTHFAEHRGLAKHRPKASR